MASGRIRSRVFEMSAHRVEPGFQSRPAPHRGFAAQLVAASALVVSLAVVTVVISVGIATAAPNGHAGDAGLFSVAVAALLGLAMAAVGSFAAVFVGRTPDRHPQH
jgi:hypothetical protein